jgi:hypothetical protein
MTRTRGNSNTGVKVVVRKVQRSKHETARSLLNHGLSKIQRNEWLLIARSPSEAKLPNSICQAMGLGFDDLLPLLIEAGILKFSTKKCATDRSMEVKTDQIISLNAQFLNLAIKHTYRYMPDVCSMYTKFYFIGRGELGSKPVYGAGVDKIKQISYSAKQREDILEIRQHNYPLLATFKAGDESLYVDTGLSCSKDAGTGSSAALITPTDADQQLDFMDIPATQSMRTFSCFLTSTLSSSTTKLYAAPNSTSATRAFSTVSNQL